MVHFLRSHGFPGLLEAEFGKIVFHPIGPWMPLAENVSQCDLRVSILCLLCLAVCFFGYRIYRHPTICRALFHHFFFCFSQCLNLCLLTLGSSKVHLGPQIFQTVSSNPPNKMGGPWATGPSHRPVVGRFAFGVFAFLVGFGLQAALGSAWIRQSEGHGITEKAPKKPKRGGDRGSGAWGRYREKHGETVYRIILVGDLEHFFIFPDIGNNNPN